MLPFLWRKWAVGGDIEKTLVESGDTEKICMVAGCTEILDNNGINITVLFSN